MMELIIRWIWVNNRECKQRIAAVLVLLDCVKTKANTTFAGISDYKILLQHIFSFLQIFILIKLNLMLAAAQQITWKSGDSCFILISALFCLLLSVNYNSRYEPSEHICIEKLKDLWSLLTCPPVLSVFLLPTDRLSSLPSCFPFVINCSSTAMSCPTCLHLLARCTCQTLK